MVLSLYVYTCCRSSLLEERNEFVARCLWFKAPKFGYNVSPRLSNATGIPLVGLVRVEYWINNWEERRFEPVFVNTEVVTSQVREHSSAPSLVVVSGASLGDSSTENSSIWRPDFIGRAVNFVNHSRVPVQTSMSSGILVRNLSFWSLYSSSPPCSISTKTACSSTAFWCELFRYWTGVPYSLGVSSIVTQNWIPSLQEMGPFWLSWCHLNPLFGLIMSRPVETRISSVLPHWARTCPMAGW